MLMFNTNNIHVNKTEKNGREREDERFTASRQKGRRPCFVAATVLHRIDREKRDVWPGEKEEKKKVAAPLEEKCLRRRERILGLGLKVMLCLCHLSSIPSCSSICPLFPPPPMSFTFCSFLTLILHCLPALLTDMSKLSGI